MTRTPPCHQSLPLLLQGPAGSAGPAEAKCHQMELLHTFLIPQQRQGETFYCFKPMKAGSSAAPRALGPPEEGGRREAARVRPSCARGAPPGEGRVPLKGRAAGDRQLPQGRLLCQERGGNTPPPPPRPRSGSKARDAPVTSHHDAVVRAALRPVTSPRRATHLRRRHRALPGNRHVSLARWRPPPPAPNARRARARRDPAPPPKKPQPLVDRLANQLARHVPAAMRARFQTVSGGGFAAQPSATGAGRACPALPPSFLRSEGGCCGRRLAPVAVSQGGGRRGSVVMRKSYGRPFVVLGRGGRPRRLRWVSVFGAALCRRLLPRRGPGGAGQGGPGGRCFPGRREGAEAAADELHLFPPPREWWRLLREPGRYPFRRWGWKGL